MNYKAVLLLGAALVSMGLTGFAKDKGNPVKFPNWGIVYVPDSLYMEPGRQPMLTAGDYDNDVVTMLESIYPLEPETYQLVQKDGASFQYGYLVHYSANIWEIEAATQGKRAENAYLRDIGSRPNVATLMERANEAMEQRLPQGFVMTEPITAKKIKGKTFYEGTWQKGLIINGKKFVETIQGVAYQRGDYIEIALIFANVADSDNNLIDTMKTAFETAEKLPKK